MKGQLKVGTPKEYIAKLAEPRKSDIATLDRLIRKAAPKLEPRIEMGILAYGHCKLKYANGKEREWFQIGVASNASYISLYVSGTEGTGFRVADFKKDLPKAKFGGGCVKFKRLSDVDEAVLARMIREGVGAKAEK